MEGSGGTDEMKEKGKIERDTRFKKRGLQTEVFVYSRCRHVADTENS